jgi:hypothetical protein
MPDQFGKKRNSKISDVAGKHGGDAPEKVITEPQLSQHDLLRQAKKQQRADGRPDSGGVSTPSRPERTPREVNDGERMLFMQQKLEAEKEKEEERREWDLLTRNSREEEEEKKKKRKKRKVDYLRQQLEELALTGKYHPLKGVENDGAQSEEEISLKERHEQLHRELVERRSQEESELKRNPPSSEK